MPRTKADAVRLLAAAVHPSAKVGPTVDLPKHLETRRAEAVMRHLAEAAEGAKAMEVDSDAAQPEQPSEAADAGSDADSDFAPSEHSESESDTESDAASEASGESGSDGAPEEEDEAPSKRKPVKKTTNKDPKGPKLSAKTVRKEKAKEADPAPEGTKKKKKKKKSDVPRGHIDRQLAHLMKRLAKQVTPFIPRRAMERVVREVGQEFKTDLRWSPFAVKAMQVAAEEVLTEFLRGVDTIAANEGPKGVVGIQSRHVTTLLASSINARVAAPWMSKALDMQIELTNKRNGQLRAVNTPDGVVSGLKIGQAVPLKEIANERRRARAKAKAKAAATQAPPTAPTVAA